MVTPTCTLMGDGWLTSFCPGGFSQFSPQQTGEHNWHSISQGFPGTSTQAASVETDILERCPKRQFGEQPLQAATAEVPQGGSWGFWVSECSAAPSGPQEKILTSSWWCLEEAGSAPKVWGGGLQMGEALPGGWAGKDQGPVALGEGRGPWQIA